ncbi:MAG: ABC transporter ATP-binding protein [Sporichthyaceae bacterium]
MNVAAPVPGPQGDRGDLSPLLDVDDLWVVHDRVPGRRREVNRVVAGVDLRADAGEIVGLVGESGCGKTTLARAIVGLHRPVAGHVRVGGVDVHHLRGRAWREHRRAVAMVFQEPLLALNPRWSVHDSLSEPLIVHKLGNAAERAAKVREMLDLVALPPALAQRRPAEMSGGQRQRVAIARALIAGPSLLVCDEPVTALDVLAQATILDLLLELRSRLTLTCLFIAHDLAAVARVADRIAVMHQGRIVEDGAADRVLSAPRHPHTQALLAAVPRGLDHVLRPGSASGPASWNHLNPEQGVHP